MPSPLRHLNIEGVPSARGRERAMPLSRFAGGFSDEVLDETAKKLAGWWSEVKTTSVPYLPSDFGLDAEQAA